MRQKFSVNRSMKILSLEFLEQYYFDLHFFKDKDDVLSALYFHWLRRSAEKGHYWSKSSSTDYFTDDFAEEMKVRLRFVFHKVYYNHAIDEYRRFVSANEEQKMLS
jgi:hypothetical protein